MKTTLRRLSVFVFTAFAVTGSAAIVYGLRCIPMLIRMIRDLGGDVSDRGLSALTKLLGAPALIFLILLVAFVIMLLIFEAVTLRKKLQNTLRKETYALFWNYSVFELITLLVNGVLFYAITSMGYMFDGVTEERVTVEFLIWFIIYLISAICAIIALVISFREKRYE